jgi:hypothetical protein
MGMVIFYMNLHAKLEWPPILDTALAMMGKQETLLCEQLVW